MAKLLGGYKKNHSIEVLETLTGYFELLERLLHLPAFQLAFGGVVESGR